MSFARWNKNAFSRKNHVKAGFRIARGETWEFTESAASGFYCRTPLIVPAEQSANVGRKSSGICSTCCGWLVQHNTFPSRSFLMEVRKHLRCSSHDDSSTAVSGHAFSTQTNKQTLCPSFPTLGSPTFASSLRISTCYVKKKVGSFISIFKSNVILSSLFIHCFSTLNLFF